MFPLENLIFYIFSKIEKGLGAKAFYRAIFILSCEYCRYFAHCIPSVDFIKRKNYPYSPDVAMLLERMRNKDRTVALQGSQYVCRRNKYNPVLFTEEERALFNRVFFTCCYRNKQVPINFENNPVWKRASYDEKLYITKNNLRSVDVTYTRREKNHAKRLQSATPVPGT